MEDNMKFGHLMEAVLYITESEGKMFDTLINLDFQEAVMEGTDDAADTDKEKNSKINEIKSKFTAENIKNKADEIIRKIKAMLERAFETVFNKILGFIKADSKIVKRYKEIINNADLSNFPGIENFSMPTGYPKEVDCMKLMSTSNDQNIVSDEFEKAIKEANEYIDSLFPKKEELYKPDESTLKNDTMAALDGIGESSIIIKNLKAQKWSAKVDEIKRIWISKDVRSANESSDKFDALAVWCKLISKVSNIYLNGCINVFKHYRKLALTVGAYAMKQAINNKNNVSESVEALVYIIGESSDEAVNEAFAY